MLVGNLELNNRLHLLRTLSYLYATSALIIFNATEFASAQEIIDGGASETVIGTGGGTQASPWTVGGNLTVGHSGTGTLIIQEGGAVINSTGIVGNRLGSSGAVVVTGTGSSWTNSSSFSVGFSGVGILDIDDGGTVTNTSGILGRVAGSNGTATVTGAGSNWINLAGFSVGFHGAGNLDIENGGTVSNTYGFVGRNAGSVGNMTINGAGSSWSNSMGLFIGRSGTGTLNIIDGSVVSVISGAGTVDIGEFAGSSGTLNIGGAAGDAAVAPGSLNAANVDFGLGTGKIVFNHTDAQFDFVPIISGAGSIEVYTGTTQFNANHTYSEDTSIYGGTLLVNGSLASDTIVFDGGVLGGTGILNNVSIESGGKLSPGNSIGTITTGDLTLSAGSTVEIELGDVGVSDKIVVTGTLDVTGANLVLNKNFTSYTGTDMVYTIIENDGNDTVSGTFSTVTDVTEDLPFLTTNVDYAGDTGNDVVLTLARTNTFTDLVETNANQKSVGVALDNLDSTIGSEGEEFRTLLTPLTTSQAQQTLTDLAGDVHASAFNNMIDAGSNVSAQVAGRFVSLGQSLTSEFGYAASTQLLSANSTSQSYFATDLAVNTSDNIGYGYTPTRLPSNPKIQYWGGVSGYFSNVDSKGNAIGTNSNGYGIILGGDKTIGYNSFGAAFAYGITQVKSDDNLSFIEMDSYSAALYGQHEAINGITFNGSANYNYHSIKGNRTISNLNVTALSDYVAHQATIQGEVSKRIIFDQDKDIIPFALGRYNYISSGAFTETGAAGANLISEGEDYSNLEFVLGARMEIDLNDNSRLMFGAGYSHNFGDYTPDTSFAFAGGGSFTAQGVSRNKQSVYFLVGFEKAISDNKTFFAKSSGNLALGRQSISGNVGFKIKF